jgi:hypothetical protein
MRISKQDSTVFPYAMEISEGELELLKDLFCTLSVVPDGSTKNI